MNPPLPSNIYYKTSPSNRSKFDDLWLELNIDIIINMSKSLNDIEDRGYEHVLESEFDCHPPSIRRFLIVAQAKNILRAHTELELAKRRKTDKWITKTLGHMANPLNYTCDISRIWDFDRYNS